MLAPPCMFISDLSVSMTSVRLWGRSHSPRIRATTSTASSMSKWVASLKASAGDFCFFFFLWTFREWNPDQEGSKNRNGISNGKENQIGNLNHLKVRLLKDMAPKQTEREREAREREREREREGSEPYADATLVYQTIWGRIGPTDNWAIAVEDDDSLQNMRCFDRERDHKSWNKLLCMFMSGKPIWVCTSQMCTNYSIL